MFSASLRLFQKNHLCSYFEKKQRFREVADGGEIDWQVSMMMMMAMVMVMVIMMSSMADDYHYIMMNLSKLW